MTGAIGTADEALDHLQITECLARYCQALARQDWDELEREVMSEDAVLVVVLQSSEGTVREQADGRDEIVDWFRSNSNPKNRGKVRISLSTHVISIDGDAARSTSHLSSINAETLENVATGIVSAEHVRTDSGWRIRLYDVVESISAASMKARAGFQVGGAVE